MADQGLTDAQISAQLQKMNNSQKSIIGVKTTCPGSTTAISSYLADMKNSTVNAKSGGSVSSSYSTTIYTTSSGKDLVCTTPNPA